MMERIRHTKWQLCDISVVCYYTICWTRYIIGPYTIVYSVKYETTHGISTPWHTNNEGIFIALLHEASQRLTLLPLLIRRINHSWNHLSSLGSIQLLPFRRIGQTQQPTLPSQVPINSWVERSNYCKVHGRGRGSNLYSDDSAIRTQLQCTPQIFRYQRVDTIPIRGCNYNGRLQNG